MGSRTGVKRELAARAELSVLRWLGYLEIMEENLLVMRIVGSDIRS